MGDKADHHTMNSGLRRGKEGLMEERWSVWLIATAAAISVVMAAPEGWAKSRKAASGGRDAAVQKCITQVQAEFGGPRNSPDEDARVRVNRYKSCMTDAGYRP